MKLIKKISIFVLLSIFISQFSIITYISFNDVNINNFGHSVYAETNLGGGNSSSNSIPLENPLKNGGIKDIPTFVEKLLSIVMKVGVPLVAIAIIYTGYLFIAAQGNPEKLKTAKDAILYVFIGAVILLGAYVIAQTLQGTINSIRGN